MRVERIANKLRDLIASKQLAVVDLKHPTVQFSGSEGKFGRVMYATQQAMEELSHFGVYPLQGPDSVMEVFDRVDKGDYLYPMDSMQAAGLCRDHFFAFLSSAKRLSLTSEGQAKFAAEEAARLAEKEAAQARDKAIAGNKPLIALLQKEQAHPSAAIGRRTEALAMILAADKGEQTPPAPAPRPATRRIAPRPPIAVPEPRPAMAAAQQEQGAPPKPRNR